MTRIQRNLRRTVAGCVVGLSLVSGQAVRASGANHPEFGPLPPQNKATAANGLALMHGDTASSDTTPVRGPGVKPVSITSTPLSAVCPSILITADGYPIATCTAVPSRKPTVYLIDPKSGQTLASLAVTKGKSLLGGVYTYLDAKSRVVIVDGNNDLLRLSHVKRDGKWSFVVSSRVSLAKPIKAECGAKNCDTVVGLVPDAQGRVWFATQHGLIGTLNPATHRIRSIHFPKGEQIGNSISTVPGYTSAVTDHALYLLRAGKSGVPQILYRRTYTRGKTRKPGQLTHGSGTTPVIFGPKHGTEYVSIMDNARPHEHLIVYRMPAKRRTHPFKPTFVCKIAVVTEPANSGTEDAPIGSGRSVIVQSTYGYTYPAGAQGKSDPSSAPFVGGMERVDVKRSGHGCVKRWEARVRSSALPRLSIKEKLIYTIVSDPVSPGETNEDADTNYYVVIDADTGKVRAKRLIGHTPNTDPLQLVGTTDRRHIFWNGTLAGFVRIAPAGT